MGARRGGSADWRLHASRSSGVAIGGLVDGSLLFTTDGATITFRNTRIYVAPNDDSRWRINDVTAQTGVLAGQQVVVVPNATYQIVDFDHAGTGNSVRFSVLSPCAIDPPGGVIIGVTAYRISCAPSADAGEDITSGEAVTVTLDGSASTVAPDTTPGYNWSQLAGPAVTLDGASTSTPSLVTPFVSPEDGSQVLTFQLIVSDGFTDSEPDVVNVTVVHTNRAPQADAGNDVAIREGTAVLLDGTNSFDPDGDELTYRWFQRAWPLVTLSTDTSASPSFQAPSGSTTLLFQLQVSDGSLVSDLSAGDDASSADTVRVDVVENGIPHSDAGDAQSVDEGSTVQLDGTGSSDPDGDGLSYLWSQTAGPAVLLDDVSAASPSFTAPQVGAGGATLEFALTVSDDYAAAPRTSPVSTTIVHVRDLADPPNCSTARPTIETIWPPDHKMVEVSIDGIPVVNGERPSVSITAVTQDEPTTGLGDGDTAPDAVITGNKVLLRAERSGTGDGRVYRIHFTATSEGLSCSGSVFVAVPHSRKAVAADSGQQYDSTE